MKKIVDGKEVEISPYEHYQIDVSKKNYISEDLDKVLIRAEQKKLRSDNMEISDRLHEEWKYSSNPFIRPLGRAFYWLSKKLLTAF